MIKSNLMKWSLAFLFAVILIISYGSTCNKKKDKDDAAPVVGSSAPVYYSTGVLDATFGTGGVVTTTIGSNSADARAIAIQPDGKILAAGFANNDFCLARYTTTGALDTSFGTGGVVTSSVTANCGIRDVAIQSDGKILAIGFADSDFALARYYITGTLDVSFGTAGVVTTSFGAGTNNDPYSIAIQSDGKIIAAGNSFNGFNSYFALARYNTTGTLDTSFGTNGVVTSTFGTTPYFTKMVLQEDGKIVACGNIWNGPDCYFATARYTSAGVLDTDFSGDGVITTTVDAVSPQNDYAYSLFIQPDNKILVGGFSQSGSDYNRALVRYTSAGVLDTSFGGDGIITATTLSGIDSESFSIGMQSNGKIVIAGTVYNGSYFDITLWRYTSAGELDTSFDSDGIFTVNNGVNSWTNKVKIQPDGKILVVGASNSQFCVMRIK
jgi:uncharacterized delta-60 repeat protein